MKKNLLLVLILLLGISIKAQVTFDSNEHPVITPISHATDIVLADIDEDGINDLLTTGDNNPGDICWYKGDGEGNYTEKSTILNITGKDYVYAADLNGDNHMDALFSCYSDHTLVWYANDGTGVFTTGGSIDVNGATELKKAFVYDIDKDGDMDIAAIFQNVGSNKLVWYKNDGSGTFGAENIIFDKSSDPGNGNFVPTDIYISDLNNDGYGDILVSSSGDTGKFFKWFLFDGTAWTTDEYSCAGLNPFSVIACDMDNDGDKDIVGGFYDNSTDDDFVIWIENIGNATFATTYTTCLHSTSTCSISGLQIANLDSKGNNIVALDNNNEKIYFLTNYDDGASFGKSELSHLVASSVAFEDIGSDGDMDMISPSTSSTIAWLNNITPIIQQSPQNADPVCEGTDSVLFTVKAINVWRYRWQEDYGSGFSDISTTDSHYHGVETDTLYVEAWYANMDGYKYRCRILGVNPALPRDTSDIAVLTVDKKITALIGTHDFDRDLKLCEQTSYILKGNDPLPHTGNWTSSVAGTTFDNSSVYNTNANITSGSMQLYWTINNKSCGLSTDTMIIRNYTQIIADAGADESICDTSKYQLHGNQVSELSSGAWKASRDEVTFDNNTLWNATASNLPAGIGPTTTFTWTINNGECGYSQDDATITHYETVIADAGDDVTICGQTVTSLHGNDPEPQGAGSWTASNAQVVFDNSTYNSVNLSNIPHGITTFTWTITVPTCGSSSDDLVLSSYTGVNVEQQPTDQTVTEGEKVNLKIKISGDVKTYQWFKGNNSLTDDTRINGSTLDSLVIDNTMQSDTGNYKCVFVDYCYDQNHDSEIAYLTVNASTTGFEDLQQSGITIYPNPNNGQFKIKNTGDRIDKISIISMGGKLVYKQDGLNNSIFVDISNYPKGVYILSVDKGMQSFKYSIIMQ